MNTPEEHAAAVMRAPGQITVASIAGAIRAYADEVKGSQIEHHRSQLETELQKHLSAAQGQIAELARQLSITQEVLRVTKNALARLTAERDAERTARRALTEALKWVVTIEDNPLRGTTVRLPFSCEHAGKNALALAAKLP